jgi:hypothetical protein
VQQFRVGVVFEVDRVVLMNDSAEMVAAETQRAQTRDRALCGSSVGEDRSDVIVIKVGIEL